MGQVSAIDRAAQEPVASDRPGLEPADGDRPADYLATLPDPPVR
jgi:hypothetical protein